MLPGEYAREHRSLETARRDDIARRRARHGLQIDHAQTEQARHRRHLPARLEPRGRVPLPGQRRGCECNDHHDATMAEREQRAGCAREARSRGRVQSRKAVDDGQMIGIQAVPRPER